MFQRHQSGEIRHIAIHTEDAFRDNDDPLIFSVMLTEQYFQLGIILMETHATGSGKPDAVYQTGVHQLVGKYQGTGIAHRRKDARVHVVATVEDQCAFRSEEVGKQVFHFLVHRKIPGEQTGGGGSEK